MLYIDAIKRIRRDFRLRKPRDVYFILSALSTLTKNEFLTPKEIMGKITTMTRYPSPTEREIFKICLVLHKMGMLERQDYAFGLTEKGKQYLEMLGL